MFMATKNEKELKGMKEAHIRDAVAIIEFLTWFEKEIGSGKVMNEVDVDRELTARRAAQEGFKGLSFPTIAGRHTPLTPASSTSNPQVPMAMEPSFTIQLHRTVVD